MGWKTPEEVGSEKDGGWRRAGPHLGITPEIQPSKVAIFHRGIDLCHMEVGSW